MVTTLPFFEYIASMEKKEDSKTTTVLLDSTNKRGGEDEGSEMGDAGSEVHVYNWRTS